MRMEESLFDLREQLRAMEQKISTALHERDSLERTLAEKVNLIKVICTTALWHFAGLVCFEMSWLGNVIVHM